MTRTALENDDWLQIVDRLGGAEALEEGARESGAFTRGRLIKTAVDMLRLVLAYCLGERGLRATVAWAASVGFVDVSNPALLYRLRQCGDWFSSLVGQALAARAPAPAKGRLIRIVDATSVPKAGKPGSANGLWRIHSAFDLPTERFGAFELTEETEGETFDRLDVVPGEIRLADRAYLQADRIAVVIGKGADVVVRAGWRAIWLDEKGDPLDLIGVLEQARGKGPVDRPIMLGCKKGEPVKLRLVAVEKPPEAAAEARRKAKAAARHGGHTLSQKTLVAADWVILVTSLDETSFPTTEVLALYRLRWRIELGFKRLKSLVGLKGPPGSNPLSARPWILAHLLLILLLEPLLDELEDSPPAATAA